MFGAPEVVSGADGAEIWVGERLSGDAIDRTPPGSVRAAKLPLAADKRNTGPDAVPLPEEFGVVIPFRYAEYPASAGVELRRRTVVVQMLRREAEQGVGLLQGDDSRDVLRGHLR